MSRLRLTVPAEAGNVALVRHAVAGLADEIGMDEGGIADLKTVVTEACMNAVVHAYPDGPGPIEVVAEPRPDSLAVTVTDCGIGFQPRPDVESPGSSLRLGLSLVATLSSRFSITGAPDGGTEVAMVLPLTRADTAPGLDESETEEAAPEGISITASDREVLPGVLSRAVSAFALRRDLTVDQIADAMLLAESVSDSSDAAFAGAQLNFSLADGDGGIEMTVGPLGDGGGGRLRDGLKLPEEGGSVEALADSVNLETRGDGEYVTFRFAPADLGSAGVAD
jgi:anti-sigma regulatory factor (Ser/Thr protein kinase)